MQFEWDINKNRLNKEKHGISFETASLVFLDPFILSVLDNRYHYEEERWQSIGSIQSVLIYVAHTAGEYHHDEEIIRIISARAATPRESNKYTAHRHGRK